MQFLKLKFEKISFFCVFSVIIVLTGIVHNDKTLEEMVQSVYSSDEKKEQAMEVLGYTKREHFGLLLESLVGEKNSTTPEQFTPKDETANMVKCAICWGVLQKPTSTSCGHIFCNNCIIMALKNKKSCPVCKTPISTKTIHPIFW